MPRRSSAPAPAQGRQRCKRVVQGMGDGFSCRVSSLNCSPSLPMWKGKMGTRVREHDGYGSAIPFLLLTEGNRYTLISVTEERDGRRGEAEGGPACASNIGSTPCR